jgi:hypothetical protein
MRDVMRAANRGLLLLGCSLLALCETGTAVEANQPFLLPNTLVVSTSTYDNSQGAVATLTPGQTQLAGSDGAPPTCTIASAANDYVNVWNNAATDGSFGVTSEITLSDIDANSGHVHSALAIPTSQVVTSFSSKSELGLHVAAGPNGPVVSFMAYGGAGVGSLDVSNSDAVPGQDPTNPVTGCFVSGDYAFARTFVTVAKNGTLAYTPTIDYGGNNGRSALYSSDAGLYYSVGNANNGNANAYGYNCPGTTTARNCTNPDVTETTGLEAINPLDWPSYNYGTIPNGNSAQVDPLFASVNGDKAGKDSNFRGVTEFDGALYFTKGSGSNGIDTVYTVSPLPTVSSAGSASVGIVPGFPTDVARTTGGNFTPFAVFFANATTMYVTDEGSGNATDASQHAGLEKWSLVNGTWQLDYVLTNRLIGTQYQLSGYDGPWPAVTTVGLRNLAGKVNANGTVTLWATTSTSSNSGDNGADPNELVVISDSLAATQASQVSGESFGVFGAPTYGIVYRGVAYVGQQ